MSYLTCKQGNVCKVAWYYELLNSIIHFDIFRPFFGSIQCQINYGVLCFPIKLVRNNYEYLHQIPENFMVNYDETIEVSC